MFRMGADGGVSREMSGMHVLGFSKGVKVKWTCRLPRIVAVWSG